MITITLNQILAHNPCASDWAKIFFARGKINKQELDQTQAISDDRCAAYFNKLADDKPFPLADALDSNGLDDTLWAMRCLPGEYRLWRKYAVWCARQVQHLMADQRSIDALDIAWRYSEGMATEAELHAAEAAAWVAALDAAEAAARVAAEAAAWVAGRDAAVDAAWGAARDAAEAAAWGAGRDAALDAARDAAWVAGRDAAVDAAWGAALDARRHGAWDATRVAQALKLRQILDAGHWVD